MGKKPHAQNRSDPGRTWAQPDSCPRREILVPLAAPCWWKRKKKHRLQVLLCPPPPHPANPGLGGCNYFWQGVNRSWKWTQKTRVIYERQHREPASEPGYRISRCKVTLVCLEEQLCEVMCRWPGKITSLNLPRKASNGNGAWWTTRKHFLTQLQELYHKAGRLWVDVHQDDLHSDDVRSALNWPWQLPASLGYGRGARRTSGP